MFCDISVVFLLSLVSFFSPFPLFSPSLPLPPFPSTHSPTSSCKPGVMGPLCDQCMEGTYNFSSAGCAPCECDTVGSVSANCSDEGQCQCKVHTHTHTHTHTHAHTHAHTHTHIHTHTHTRTHTRTCTRTRTHTHAHAHAHTHMHARTHTHAHTHAHAQPHAHTHAHTYTPPFHTNIPSSLPPSLPPSLPAWSHWSQVFRVPPWLLLFIGHWLPPLQLLRPKLHLPARPRLSSHHSIRTVQLPPALCGRLV